MRALVATVGFGLVLTLLANGSALADDPTRRLNAALGDAEPVDEAALSGQVGTGLDSAGRTFDGHSGSEVAVILWDEVKRQRLPRTGTGAPGGGKPDAQVSVSVATSDLGRSF